VQVLHRNVPIGNWGEPKAGEALADSYLLAVNPADGKNIFRHVRPTDAKAESQESYGTPIPWERPTRTELLITGGDCITGHDPETGAELWRAGGWNPQKIGSWRLVPSAVTWDGLVYTCPPKGGQILAWKEGGNGEVTATHQAWKANGLTSDVCVPLVYENYLYVLDGDKKQLACVDPKTGEKKWAGTIDSRPVLRASPTGAEGKIYVMNENGEVWVLAAGVDAGFKILSKTNLDGAGSRGSVAAVDGMILIRTGDRVWAFGKK
jgi:outer membrane protein assembly factor BamB